MINNGNRFYLVARPFGVFSELANTMKYGGGSYITLFSRSDVTAFHRISRSHVFL